MTDDNKGQLTANPGETSEDFRKRIEESISQVRTATAQTVDNQGKTDELKPNPGPEAKPDNSKSALAVTTPEKSDKVDPVEWANKKGLKTPEAIAKSLRALEKEFHRRNQGKSKPAPAPAPDVVPVAPPNLPAMPPQMPSYPGQYPVGREQAIRDYASKYNMDPEDFQRVLALASDVANIQNQGIRNELDSLRSDQKRNSELITLSQDPLFQKADVQFELHKILEEDPAIFQSPTPYADAFNKVKDKIARKYLEGSGASPSGSIDAGNTPPSTPPSQGGSGTGAGGTPPAKPEMSDFNKLSTEDQAKVLSRIGVRG